MLAFAFPGYIYFLAAKFQDAPILGSAYLIDAFLWYVSFYLLFTGDTPAWFRHHSVAPIAPEPQRQ
jgi:hypothetical protein